MQHPKKNYLTLALLVILFLIPGFAAIIVFQHPEWITAMKTNKGKLLNPPYALSSPETDSKWQLFYWHPGVCDKLCLQTLDKLGRVRLALGRKLYQVNIQLLQGKDSPDGDVSLKETLRLMDIKSKRLSTKDSQYVFSILQQDGVLIGSPDNFLVLSYTDLGNPMNVYEDLKHLLTLDKSTEGRNGTS